MIQSRMAFTFSTKANCTFTLAQSDLVNVRQSYAEVTASQRRLVKKKEQVDSVANDWYRRAQLAIEKGNDVLAKEALVRRQMALDELNNLVQQVNIQNSALEKLYDGMILLEKKIVEAQNKKEQMVARARTARSTVQVNDMLSGLTGTTSMDAFKRMEEKVEALEAQAEVSMDMIQFMELPSSLTSSKSSSSYIEREFQLLEAASSVDAELEAMKKKLYLGSGSSGGFTPIPEATTTTTTTVTTTTKKEPTFVEIPIKIN